MFFCFQTPIDLAHAYWKLLLKPGDHVIDATCGNGKDTLHLALLCLGDGKGSIHAIDIQKKALDISKQRLQEFLTPSQFAEIKWYLGSHETFPDSIEQSSIKLIVYNLGYLPGGDKSLTTKKESTLKSLNAACNLLSPGGALSIMCYPGHPQGQEEELDILEWAKALSPKSWNCCYHTILNRQTGPRLLLIQKTLS